MPYAPLAEQTVHRITLFARVMLVLSLAAIFMSLPAIALAGFGLVMTIPLLTFFIMNIKFLNAVHARRPLPKKEYTAYIISGILGGAASAFGFFTLGTGIDAQPSPSLPYFIMAYAGVPLITFFVVFAAHKWSKQFS